MPLSHVCTVLLLLLCLSLRANSLGELKCLKDLKGVNLPVLGKGNNPEPIVFHMGVWPTAQMSNRVFKVLIEEILGIPVSLDEGLDSKEALWLAMHEGRIAGDMEIYPDDNIEQYTKYVVEEGTVKSAGFVGPPAENGLYLPAYTVDRFPSLASGRGLRDPEVAKHFINKTFDSSKGSFLAGLNPWILTYQVQQWEANMGFEFKPNYLADYGLVVGNVLDAISRHEDIIFAYYHPDGLFYAVESLGPEYALEKIALYPRWNESCIPLWEAGKFNCDAPHPEIHKVYSVAANMSANVVFLLESLSFSTFDHEKTTGKFYFEGYTMDEAVCDWIRTNPDKWLKAFRHCKNDCSSHGQCFVGVCSCDRGWFGDDCSLEQVMVYIDWSDGIAIVFVVLASVVIFLTLSFALFMLVNLNKPVVKGSSPIVMMIILTGLVIGLSSVYIQVGRPNKWRCTLPMWLWGVSFVLVFGSMAAKAFRIWRIMLNADRYRVKVVTVSTSLAFIAGLMVVELLLLTLWTIFYMPEGTVVPDDEDVYEADFVCDYSVNFDPLGMIMIAYKGMVLFVCAILSYFIRKINQEARESLEIGVIIYNMLVCGAVFVALYILLNGDMILQFLMLNIAIVFITLVTLLGLSSRVVWLVVVRGGETTFTGTSTTGS
mmetsp:Transcript_10083/g.25208  ORF Transcript_10083/g.25208 Transcript_10083/m.25208 type:complete len:655 (-) Transcript_10083:192-2156(-)